MNFEAELWLPDGEPTLDGPNAHVFSDIDDDDVAQPGDEISRANGNADFPKDADDLIAPAAPQPDDACAFTPPPPSDWVAPLATTARCSWDPTVASSWQTNREQNGVEAFYLVNEFHDHLETAPIGFDAASGNFEGVDKIQVNTDDGADTDGGLPDGDHIDNANMTVPPDDDPVLKPTMQMYLFAYESTPFFKFRNINGGDDAATVWHEYTHGLSSRLITHADGSSAVSSPHAGAMGEAWSDWYALDLLHSRHLEIDDGATPGQVDIGVYSDAVFASTRFEPVDCPVGSTDAHCPGGLATGPGGFTLGDFGHVFTAPEVHSDGEIWTQTLWDLRTALIAAHGEQDGVKRAEALVTEAMRLSPPEPSFLDMRNAILAADVALAGGDRDTIWEVFRSRGMGFYARAANSSDTTPVEDFTAPPNVLPSGVLHTGATRVNPGDPVLFGASFTDPDSQISGYQWDFDGDGTVDRSTTGPTTTFAYAKGGDYTARVVVTDVRGGAGSGTAPIHVTTNPAVGTLPRRGTKGRARFKVTCDLRCTATAKLTLSKRLARQLGLKKKRTVGSLRRTLGERSSKRLSITLTSKARRALKRHHRKSVKATLAVTVRYADGRRKAAHRTLTIKL